MENDRIERMEKLLREDMRLNKENHKIIKKIYTYFKWNRAFKILYWGIIIGSVLGLFYFIQPYVEAFKGYFISTQNAIQNPTDFFESLLSGDNPNFTR